MKQAAFDSARWAVLCVAQEMRSSMHKQATTGLEGPLNQISSHNFTQGMRCAQPRPSQTAFAGSMARKALRVRGVLAVAAVLLGAAAGAQAQAAVSPLAVPFPQTTVGQSRQQTINITLTVSTTVSTVKVLTSGLENGPEFTEGTSSCAGSSGTCTESVIFKPLYPGMRLGAVELLDAGNNVIGTVYLSGVGMGGLDVLSPGYMTTVAGSYLEPTGSSGTGDGGLATSASLSLPASVVADGAGNLYIADELNSQVRMICSGTNSETITGVNCTGPGIIVTLNLGVAQLINPTGVALDGAGNLYIADTGNHIIREVTAANGAVTTVAGDGTAGFMGDGGPATMAELNSPAGVTIDASGNIFIADTDNNLIRRVDALTGDISTVAGGGMGPKGTATGATLSAPYAVAFDALGNMYIPDSGNNMIRKVAPFGGVITPSSTISPVAGSGEAGTGCIIGSTPVETPLNTPEGIAVDAAGNLYIADSKDGCVLKTNGTGGIISLAAAGNFIMTPLIPTGVQGLTSVLWPRGIFVDRTGNVFFADYFGDAIDEVHSNLAVLDFLPTVILDGGKSTPIAQNVENVGNAPSQLDSISALPANNAELATPPTTCDLTPPTPFQMPIDVDCTIGAVFLPTTVGTLEGNIFVTGDTPNDNDNGTPAPQLDIMFFGRAATFTLTLTANGTEPALTTSFGTQVKLVATLVGSAATGTVTFTDSVNGGPAATLKSVTVTADSAELTESALPVGVHTITATFSGNSFPTTVTVTVQEATKTVLTSATNPSTLGNAVTLLATVSAPAGGGQTLGGTVTFSNATANTSSTVTIAAPGTTDPVTFAAPASWFVDGANLITAVYTPPASSPLILGSSSEILSQDVQATTTIIVTTSLNPSTYGTAVTFTANLSSSPTGTVKFYDGATAIGTGSLAGTTAKFTTSALAVGSHSITAVWAGNSDYRAATSPAITQVVTEAETKTTVAASPNPGIAGAPVALTATVKLATGSATITGKVTFTDGTTTLGTATLSAAGTATINPILAAGSHAIVATYSGSSNDVGSTSSALALEVILATTTATVSASPDPALVLSTITFTATVTGNGGIPTGSVALFANGSINLGSGTLNGAGTAQVTNATLAAGTYQITAVYSGDANNAGTTSAAIKEVVGTLPTNTNLGSAATTGSKSQLILVGTVTDTSGTGPVPTGTVTFTSGTTVLGAATLDPSGVATLTPNLNVGTFTVVASYGGDAVHSPSQSSPFKVSSQGSAYTLTVTPSTVNLATSQNSLVTVTLASISGFTDTIGLGCASLPAGVNCHFSNLSVPLSATTPATAQLTIDTNNPLGGGATAMNRQPGPRKTEMAGLLLPFSLLMGWVLWRFRRRHAGELSMLLVLILSGAALMATGCGGFTQNTAAPGTYTFQVVGVGANSNVTEFQSVTLTITK
jgi:large repetitive protein